MKKTTTRKLTDSAVQKASCPAGQSSIKLQDAGCPGLFLRVDASGHKSWLYEQRMNGRLYSTKLGDVRVFDLAAARKLAQQHQTQTELAAPSQICVTLDEFYQHHYWPLIQQQHRAPHITESLYRNHIQCPLGSMPLDQIATQQLLSLQQQLQVQKQLQPASVNRVLAVVRALYTEAVKTHLPKGFKKPTQSLSNLKENHQTHNLIPEDNLKRLMLELKHSPQSEYLLPIIQFLALTGARKREVLDLRWRDLDLQQGHWTLPENKSGEKQHKPLSEAALIVLKQQRAHLQQLEQQQSIRPDAELAEHPETQPVLTFHGKQRVLPTEDWVFPNPITGRPFASMYRSWDTCRKKAGIPQVCIHDLRHFFASEVINAGHSLYEVKGLLGHAYASTTERYAHLKQERLKSSVNLIRCPAPSLPSTGFAAAQLAQRPPSRAIKAPAQPQQTPSNTPTSAQAAALRTKLERTLQHQGLASQDYQALLARLV